MKTNVLLSVVAILPTSFGVLAADAPQLSARRSASGLELSWPAVTRNETGTLARPFFELQRSVDFQRWQPIGERRQATSLEQSLSTTIPFDSPNAFYRLLAVQPRTDPKLVSGGAEVFGYGDAFAGELQRIGQMSPAQFAAMFPSGANYLPGISWDPTTAQFWDQFNADPILENLGKLPGDLGYRTFDFRLNPEELHIFTNNGFVVSERLGSDSFANIFYTVWHNDLPVFISTDAILQAWHRSYDAMLEELEETYLFNGFGTLLDNMAKQLPDSALDAGDDLQNSVLDADYFLAVSRSLLSGQQVLSKFGQDARVAETLADINAEQMKTVADFFGLCRVVDFSQFKVRGHYTHSERLGRYFKCVMWLGRTDLAVAGGPFDRGCGPVMAPPRELGTAIVLWHLLNQSGEFQHWVNFDRIIQAFVGWTDSMTFAQLGNLLDGAGIHSLNDVSDLTTLEHLQTNILTGNVGVQNIRSDYFVAPLGFGKIQLPRAFTVFGQKFISDSWAFSQTVFGAINVARRVPSALDAAFAVLGNNETVSDLLARIQNQANDPGRPHARRFRDGQPYQQNLSAVRAVIDAQSPEEWDSNIYMSWLAILRALSAPTTDPIYPEAMRTRAWAMKTLNTQLASWSQLRHDTILYSKQSFTGGDGCFYPAGYVEPRVSFWKRLRETATRAADLIAALPYEGVYVLGTTSTSLSVIQSNQVTHFRGFANTLATLQTLAEKELAQQPFNADEELFIRRTVELLDRGSTGYRPRPPRYEGWYFGLFYQPIQFGTKPNALFQQTYGADAADQIVADVHTDVPCGECGGDPGSVLHEGIGGVNLMMIAVNNGADRMVFAGPVLSHYEFEVIGSPRRLDDNEWKGILNNTFPSDVPQSRLEGLTPPPWTSGYLVPKP